MPTFTIAAGTTSRPHFVPAGSIVKVTPAAGASAIVEYTSTSPVGIANGVATWAPWPKGAVTAETSDRANNPISVRVTATGGAVTLDTNASPSAGDLAAFRGDWGAAAFLSAAGAGLVGPNGAINIVTGTTLGVLGDSRDDGAFGSILTGSTPQTYSQSYRSLKWALESGGQCFRRVIDVSRSGSGMGLTASTAAVHPTFPEQLVSILAAMPAYCWIRAPINDILTGSNAAAVWPAFKSLVDTVLAAGIRVELVMSVILDSTKSLYDSIAQVQIMKLNDLVRAAYGSAGALGVVLHDTATACMQQGVATYAGVTGAYQDAVHFQNGGGYLEGSQIGLNWLSRFKPLPLLGKYAGDTYRGLAADNTTATTSIPVLSSGSANILSNGLFDLGAPVNGVAQGWAVTATTNCTYAASIVSAPAWDGNSDGKGQQLAITATAASASLILESPNMYGDMKLLKRYLAAALISVQAGASNLANVRMDLRVSTNGSGGNVTFTDTHGLMNSGDDAIPSLNANGYTGVGLCDLDLSLRPDLLLTGTSYFRLRFVITFGSAGSGSANIILSRAACRLIN